MIPGRWIRITVLLLVSLGTRLYGQEPAPWRDPSPHRTEFVAVDKEVRLEILDWGGVGRPVVLLSGQGNTAHIFDEFAPKLTAQYHVYGITRRGYGASSVPARGYLAARLGDDILAVLDALKIERPVLAGHSIAGEEMSSIASRHPERVAGLVYLDAGYSYAYYDRSRGDFNIDLQELRRKLELLQGVSRQTKQEQFIQDLLEKDFPEFEKSLRGMLGFLQSPVPAATPLPAPPSPTPADRTNYQTWRAQQERTMGFSMPEGELRQIHETTPEGHVGAALSNPAVGREMIAGQQKHTEIRVPVLAIFALPHSPGRFAEGSPAALAAYESTDLIVSGTQVASFEAGVPNAKVVRLPHAHHYVFLSNEADVLREMRSFLEGLL